MTSSVPFMDPLPKKQPPQNETLGCPPPTQVPVLPSQPAMKPPQQVPEEHHKHVFQVALIVMACMVGVVMFLCTVSVVIKYLYSRRYRRSNQNIRGSPILFDVNGDSPASDDDVAVVHHPIWHIRTVGLQQSVIDSITVFKYRKHEGIVDGTECSVCLGEFEQDESLRLLPKCSHAFHIPCIDTWLRSHKNCPLCRAPVAHDAAEITAVHQVEDSHRDSNQVRIEVSSTSRPRSRRSVSVNDLSSMVNFGDVVVNSNSSDAIAKHGSGSSRAIHKVASVGRAFQKRRSFSHTHCRSQSSTLPL